jgi:hypothetical protein
MRGRVGLETGTWCPPASYDGKVLHLISGDIGISSQSDSCRSAIEGVPQNYNEDGFREPFQSSVSGWRYRDVNPVQNTQTLANSPHR